MDVKPTRRGARKAPLSHPPKAGAAAAPQRAPARPPPELPAEGLRKLAGGEGGAQAVASAPPEALWGGGGRKARLDRDIGRLERELGRVEADVSRRAQHLDRKWQRGGGRFRSEVAKELQREGDLSPQLRTEVAEAQVQLQRLERQATRAGSKPEQARIEAEISQVQDELAETLRDGGAELELLMAVERAAGEEDLPGSLKSLLQTWHELFSDLWLLLVQRQMIDEEQGKKEDAQRRTRQDEVQAAVRDERVKKELLAGRLREELLRQARALGNG